MPRLLVEIRKSYPAALDSAAFDLDVRFEAGDDVTVLFGPSGAGKTLTLESIAGFIRPDQGRIELGDDVLFHSGAGVCRAARRRGCGYVFQKDALFPHMSLRQNLEFAAMTLPAHERGRRVQEVLEQFRLQGLAARRPHEVSGGERQRGAIARALIGRPRLLLLDEPARGLDVGLRRELYATLRQVRADYRLGMVLVTHDREEAFELGDRMLVCRQGRIVQSGPPREIYRHPSSPEVARLLGRINVFEGKVIDSDESRDQTRLSTGELDIATAHLPNAPNGARIAFAVDAERVLARPCDPSTRNGSDGALRLIRAVSLHDHVRLDFPGSLSVMVPEDLFEQSAGANEWSVEFPAESIWVFPGAPDTTVAAGDETRG
ncbi:MAG: ABC transporter ATP-binding protein [Acidobacteria bacterium]|nr:ABC transporter ATP-binding protein [Acidobacteriota bacterium]